jgi:hypothetical protein
MRELSRYFVPDHRDLSPEIRRIAEGRNRHERRANKAKTSKVLRRPYAQVLAILENGAGLAADQALREMLWEYNDRNWGHGLGAMPMSFNVLEAFLTFKASENWFGLRPERDHVFVFGDFLDYVTGVDAPSDPTAEAAGIPEGTIFSFNSIGDLKDLTFLHADGQQFVFGAISFIRFGSELSWLMLGGPVVDLKRESEKILNAW